MIFRLGPNQVVLQRAENLLSFRERQPDRPGRIFVRRIAATDLMDANGSVRSDQFHHGPPLHPDLPVATTGRAYHPQVLDGLRPTQRTSDEQSQKTWVQGLD